MICSFSAWYRAMSVRAVRNASISARENAGSKAVSSASVRDSVSLINSDLLLQRGCIARLRAHKTSKGSLRRTLVISVVSSNIRTRLLGYAPLLSLLFCNAVKSTVCQISHRLHSVLLCLPWVDIEYKTSNRSKVQSSDHPLGILEKTN